MMTCRRPVVGGERGAGLRVLVPSPTWTSSSSRSGWHGTNTMLHLKEFKQRRAEVKCYATKRHNTTVDAAEMWGGRVHVMPSTRGSMTDVRVQGKPDDEERSEKVQYNTEFGYSRKDIILIGVGLIAFGYAMYYGLQAMGMDAAMAGNWVQLMIFLGICVGWIGSYLFRVATKQMTYARQLEEYEEAVMKKRLEELPEAELERMMDNVEKEKDMMRKRREEKQESAEQE